MVLVARQAGQMYRFRPQAPVNQPEPGHSPSLVSASRAAFTAVTPSNRGLAASAWDSRSISSANAMGARTERNADCAKTVPQNPTKAGCPAEEVAESKARSL